MLVGMIQQNRERTMMWEKGGQLQKQRGKPDEKGCQGNESLVFDMNTSVIFVLHI